MTTQEAKNTTIFFLNFDGEIDSASEYDFIVKSAEETTSPRGVITKLFVEEENEGERQKQKWGLYHWGFGGRGPAKLVESFDTEDEAEEEWFQRTYKFDFLADDQRDTMYWSTQEEAEKELTNRNRDNG